MIEYVRNKTKETNGKNIFLEEILFYTKSEDGV
jgi:hypothetical protein